MGPMIQRRYSFIDIAGGSMEFQGSTGIYTLVGILIVIGVILYAIAKKVD